MQEQQTPSPEVAPAPEIDASVVVPTPKHRGPKTHERAGITKNHNRGQSKQRRKMAAQSRRRNSNKVA